MSGFVPIDPADIAVGKFGKQELFDLIRTNLDDLNGRVTGSLPTNVFDHFNRDSLDNNKWNFAEQGDSDVLDKVNWSDIRLLIRELPESLFTEDRIWIWSHLFFQESEVVDPLIFEARCLLTPGDTTLNPVLFEIGMGNGQSPTRRVELVRHDGSNWKFRSQNSGGTTNGTPFSSIFGSWFTVKIVFSSGAAYCFINDSEKEVLTANLPTIDALSARFFIGHDGNFGSGTIKTLRIDSCAYSPAGMLDIP